MDDPSGLASTLAARVGDVRGCLILSRDGLVVGSYQPDGGVTVKPAWIRFAAVGEPERGFVQFGTETWCYVRRGRHAAFVVAGPGARPPLVIDHMDRLLLSAGESRSNRSGAREERAVPSPPTSKPRALVHTEPRASADSVVFGSEAGAPVDAAVHDAAALESADRSAEAVGSTGSGPTDPADWATGEPSRTEFPRAGALPEPPEPPAESAGGLDAGLWDLSDDDGDVDTFSLAREFGRLLQDKDGGADG